VLHGRPVVIGRRLWQQGSRACGKPVDLEFAVFKGGIMFVPGPMEHLKSHAIAFVAGALTLVAANLYSRFLARQRYQKS
jgi:hypothetical protein